MTRSCRRSGSVRSIGTVPPSEASASDQWKLIRKWAQQAPQVRQGWVMLDWVMRNFEAPARQATMGA